MKTVDRKAAPPLREIERISLSNVTKLELSNGIPVWMINAGTQEVSKIEFIFDAGRWQEPQRAVASTTSKMLADGTNNKSSQEISEAVEFYGASFHADAAVDYAIVSLFSLNKHLPALLPLIQEIITEASFPEKELNTFIQNGKQRLMVNMQKVDFLAHREFNSKLFGSNHPNGYATSEEDYDALTADMLRNFHRDTYTAAHCKIILAGKISDDTLKLIDHIFGGEPVIATNGIYTNKQAETATDKKVFVEKEDSVQSAIRIGKLMVNKLHPDYTKIRVLNTILGGYFGSRLMQNLREEKGFCYGVHSGISSFLHHAAFAVSTEVGKEVTSAAVQEIYSEIARLRSEPVDDEELGLVKNYILGVMLADADGPFNVAEIIRSLTVYGMNETDFHRTIAEIRSVTSEELMALAVQYLNPETMIEVVAGAR